MAHEVGIEFLLQLVIERSQYDVAIESLANSSDKIKEFPPRTIQHRDPAIILRLIKQNDKAERGMFFCPSPVHGSRKKENVVELIVVWTDIDLKDVAETRAEVLKKLKQLPLKPHYINNSGHGFHVFWKIVLLEANDENKERHEAVLKMLANVLAGDPKVTHCAALLRIPGSHNSKGGDWIEVETVFKNEKTPEYRIEELEEWLGIAKPVLTSKEVYNTPEAAPVLGPKNPFERNAELYAGHDAERVDMDKRFDEMTHGGAGNTSVHFTELSVTASMATAGCDPDENVEYTLYQVMTRIGERLGWNVGSERQTLRDMVISWYIKHPDHLEKLPEGTAPAWVMNPTAVQQALQAARMARGAPQASAAPQEPGGEENGPEPAAAASKTKPKVAFTPAGDNVVSITQPRSQQAPPTPQPKGQLTHLFVEVGEEIWGKACASDGKTMWFRGGMVKADLVKHLWFDYEHNTNGNYNDLMKLLVRTREQRSNTDIQMERASGVTMRGIQWVWVGHLARGHQEISTGLPDHAKSQVQCSMIACATTGRPWPDGSPGCAPMNVFMLTAEDVTDQVVVPRLMAAGADLDRVYIVHLIKTDNRERRFLLYEDLERLERKMDQIGDVGMLTLDPITAYMGKTDSSSSTDVRAQLGPLGLMAMRRNIAVATITHPPKGAGQRAIDHFIGSQAFYAVARIGHVCVDEMEEDAESEQMVPTGRFLFTNPKHNIYEKPMPTLIYRTEKTIIKQTFEETITAPRVIWCGEDKISADQAIVAATGKQKSDTQVKVREFLFKQLAGGQIVEASEILKAAQQCGFTEKQVRTASEKLGVAKEKEAKMGGRWFWSWPTK